MDRREYFDPKGGTLDTLGENNVASGEKQSLQLHTDVCVHIGDILGTVTM